MTEERPIHTDENTAEQVDAKMARNAGEIAAINDTLSGRAAAREEFNKRGTGKLEPHPLDQYGLPGRLRLLESEQKRLAQRKRELGG